MKDNEELENNNDLLIEDVIFNSENEEDIEVDYLNKITDTVIWSTDWTIESILSAQKRLY